MKVFTLGRLVLISIFITMFSENISAASFEKNIQIELKYPIPVGDNFMANAFKDDIRYIGISNISISINFVKINNFLFGVGGDVSYLRLNTTNVNDLFGHVSINVEYPFNIGSRCDLIPRVGFGYALNCGKVYKGESYTDNGLCIKTNLKLNIDLTDRTAFGIDFGYDFTRLFVKPSIEDESFNKNLQMIYPGIGITIRF